MKILTMSLLSEQILQTLDVLTTEDQEQVLSFVEFLLTKRQVSKTTSVQNSPKSFFDVAQAFIGTGEGTGDISTNPDYMQGYGQ